MILAAGHYICILCLSIIHQKLTTMLNGLIHAHSGIRWIVLVLLIVSVFKALLKWKSKAPYTDGDRKLSFFTMLSVHIQLLLGLALYFMSDKVVFSGDAMKVAITRFFTAEHSLMMIVAIALVTIGYVKAKKAADEVKKFSLTFWYNLIALLIVLAFIPWPFRGFGSGWF